MSRDRNRGRDEPKQQGKRVGGGAGKKRAYRSRYYGSVYVERKLKRLLRSNGPATAAAWVNSRSQEDKTSVNIALGRLSKLSGLSEYSDATKTGRLATLALRHRTG